MILIAAVFLAVNRMIRHNRPEVDMLDDLRLLCKQNFCLALSLGLAAKRGLLSVVRNLMSSSILIARSKLYGSIHHKCFRHSLEWMRVS